MGGLIGWAFALFIIKQTSWYFGHATYSLKKVLTNIHYLKELSGGIAENIRRPLQTITLVVSRKALGSRISAV